MESGWESTQKCLSQENDQQNNLDIFWGKIGKIGNFASEKLCEQCSFGWEMGWGSWSEKFGNGYWELTDFGSVGTV